MGALDDTVAVVTGAEQPLGHGLALALASAGAAVGAIGTASALAPLTTEIEARDRAAVAVGADLEDVDDVERAFATVADELGGPVRAVVHAWLPPAGFDRLPIERVDDARFHAVWESSLHAAIAVLQATYRTRTDAATRVLVVTPTLSQSGAAELGPLAAAVEGARLLAKSAARQWGPYGITINCLAPAPEHVPAGLGSGTVSLAPPALGGPGDVEHDLGPAVVFLVSDAAHFVSGVTASLDGGVWMSP